MHKWAGSPEGVILFLEREFQVEGYWNFGKTWSVWSHFRAVESSIGILTSVPDQASICSAAFLCCWTCTKDFRPWQDTRGCPTIHQVWKYLLNQHKSCLWFLYICMITNSGFFLLLFFRLCALCFPPTVCHHLTLLMENEAGRTVRCVCWSWALSKATCADVMWNFISGQAPNSESGLQSMQERSFITLSYLFLSDILPAPPQRTGQALALNKREYYPILTLELYLLSWLTVAVLLNQDQGFALKTMDSHADGSWRNIGESWNMRMLQPQKLLPCCKFYKPTHKREQRLL